MRILALLALLTTVSALPRKPTKDFPKKFDASLDGFKDTYGTYERAPDEDLVVPAENLFLDSLYPPSSYDAYFERQPEDALLPPIVSTYTDVVAESEGEPMLPPPIDTYSVHPGKGHLAFVPPPSPEELESYLYYEGAGQESLVAPQLSTYAETPTDNSGADVLASLAAMIHSLPPPSTYHTYEEAEVLVKTVENAPDLVLRPPNAQENTEPKESSYSEIAEDQSTLSPEQVKAAEEASIPVPQTDLTPPKKTST